MASGHEKRDVYRHSTGFVASVYEKVGSVSGMHRAEHDQWLLASQSIPLNIAEGNGKTAAADRRRCVEIARGPGMAAMLSRLGGRGYRVKEDSAIDGDKEIDFDPDSDFDPEENISRQTDAPDARSSRW